MSRICKSCNQVFEEDDVKECPRCKTITIEHQPPRQQLGAGAKAEISQDVAERLSKSWPFAGRVAVLIVVFGFSLLSTIFGLSIWSTLQTVQNQTNERLLQFDRDMSN